MNPQSLDSQPADAVEASAALASASVDVDTDDKNKVCINHVYKFII